MTERVEKLNKLLENRFGSEENPWISKEILDDAYLGTSPSGFYSYKGKFNTDRWEDRERDVEGLPNFLKNLETWRADKILCYHLVDRGEGRTYEIYTDTEISVLVGILRFPIPDYKEPYPILIEKIKDLVGGSYGSAENPWLSKEVLETAKIQASSGDGGDLPGFQSTYERRSRWNTSQGHGIEGYYCLLANMERTTARKGNIHHVTDSAGREYAIFTDSEMVELFGILRFPEGWENRKRAFD